MYGLAQYEAGGNAQKRLGGWRISAWRKRRGRTAKGRPV
jgi:hypothetical protein